MRRKFGEQEHWSKKKTKRDMELLLNEFLTSAKHDQRKGTIASEELEKYSQVSRSVPGSFTQLRSVELNNQNKKNRKKKTVEANIKLLEVPSTREDYENNLFGLLEYT